MAKVVLEDKTLTKETKEKKLDHVSLPYPLHGSVMARGLRFQFSKE